MYQTHSSLLKIAALLTSSSAPTAADRCIAESYRRIPGWHREAIARANERVFEEGEGGKRLCWLEMQRVVVPAGNMKGDTSYNISNTRREVGAGVSAAAAPLASIAAFDQAFSSATSHWREEAYSAYLARTEEINKLLTLIIVGLIKCMVPKDVLAALLLRRASHSSFLSCPAGAGSSSSSFPQITPSDQQRTVPTTLSVCCFLRCFMSMRLRPPLAAHHRQLNSTPFPPHKMARVSSSAPDSSSAAASVCSPSSRLCYFA